MTLFSNKFRVESARLKGWDYSKSAYYFVTICVKDMACCLGEIVNEEMKLSKVGEIVAEEWEKTEKIRGNVNLGGWQVMPNHLHGIIVICKDYYVETPRWGVSKNNMPINTETPHRGVSTGNQWCSQSLGSIVNQFKSMTTKRIHQLGYQNFNWQSRFYDSIIRSEKQLNAVSEYI